MIDVCRASGCGHVDSYFHIFGSVSRSHSGVNALGCGGGVMSKLWVVGGTACCWGCKIYKGS